MAGNKQVGLFHPLVSARHLTYTTFLILFMIYSAGTINRTMAWKNNTTLWQDTVIKSPGKARAHNNMGSAYKKDGRVEDALQEYKTAVKLNPYFAEARNNLGVIYYDKGMLDEAITEYIEALKYTRFPIYLKIIHKNLAEALTKKGDIDEAILDYKDALGLDPNDYDSWYNLGILYSQKGLLNEAVHAYSKALQIKPDYTEAYDGLQKALLLKQLREGIPSGPSR